jgi:hypothetical protein
MTSISINCSTNLIVGKWRLSLARPIIRRPSSSYLPPPPPPDVDGTPRSETASSTASRKSAFAGGQAYPCTLAASNNPPSGAPDLAEPAPSVVLGDADTDADVVHPLTDEDVSQYLTVAASVTAPPFLPPLHPLIRPPASAPPSVPRQTWEYPWQWASPTSLEYRVFQPSSTDPTARRRHMRSSRRSSGASSAGSWGWFVNTDE